MNKIAKYILPVFCALMFVSCEKETKPYNGVPQVAFEKKTYPFDIQETTSNVTIPVQLIANAAQEAITASISVNSATNCSGAVTVPTSVNIEKGSFHANLVIGVNYEALSAGNANKLILDLSATGIKVAGNYNKVTITLNKK